MQLLDYQTYYFVGIGGIGMSALARFFNALGKEVAGYDRTASKLTGELETEGIAVHFSDDIKQIPKQYLNAELSLIIYTPAIPQNHSELQYFRNNGFVIQKRAAILGEISKAYKTIAVAGTHGKTTVSSMAGHLLHKSTAKQAAILGGIAKPYNSNLLMPNAQSTQVVLEADEYDRSLLQLQPWLAVITSLDADHLDIYGNLEAIESTFASFVMQIKPSGILLHHCEVDIAKSAASDVAVYSYGMDRESDFWASNIRIQNHMHVFDLHGPTWQLNDMLLQMPGHINVLNAVAACAAAYLSGMQLDELPQHLATFEGIRRRMEYRHKSANCVYIDDYAHHPAELKASISSVKAIFPDKKITGIFQPHLYTRTRDFAEEFATSLDMLDEIILLDIYPAREKEIKGISSEIIFDKLCSENKTLINKKSLLKVIASRKPEVLLTLGAGDIDKYVDDIAQWLASTATQKTETK